MEKNYSSRKNSNSKITAATKVMLLIAVLLTYAGFNNNTFAQAGTISLTTGSNIQTVCTNSAITDITYTIGGSASGASVSPLPDGIIGYFSGGSFVITGTPTTAGTYTYTVTSVGIGPQSASTGTITVHGSSLAAPVAGAALFTCGTIHTNWSDSDAADVINYYLDISTSASFTSFASNGYYHNLSLGAVTLYAANSNLTANTVYYYRVRAANGCVTSASSNTIADSVYAPAAPVAAAASNVTSTSMSANWAASSGATSYFLDVSTNSSFTDFLPGYNNLNAGNLLTYNVTGLTLCKNYYYRVRASSNNCDESLNSNDITVHTTALLSSTLSHTPICSGTVFSYAPTSASPGATFSWTRAGVAGISNPSSIGTDGVSETLVDTTNNPISVTYVYTTTAGGCVNAGENVVVTINPTPMLSSSLSPSPICSATMFNYTPASHTTGATFSWTRAGVAGISNPPGMGTDGVSETLVNITNNPISVIYVYTTTAGGCINSGENVVVTVNPTPLLNTSLNPPAICSGTAFNYTPTSLTTNVSFSWTRVAITGISNPSGIGTDGVNETLVDTTNNPISVTYVYTTTAGGCVNAGENVVVTINPTPIVTNAPTAEICSGTSLHISLTTNMPSSFTWTTGTITGNVTGASAGNGSLINQTLVNPGNSSAGTVQYIVTPTSTASCVGTAYTITATADPLPALTSTLTPAPICSDVVFTYTTASAVAGATFTWSRAAITGISNAAATGTSNVAEALMNTTAGPTTVTYVYTISANGCDSTQNVTVLVNPLPIVTAATTASSVCAGTAVTLTGNGATSYTWNGGVIDGTSFIPNSTSTYKVIGADVNNCSDTAMITITVNPIPTVNAGSGNQICFGDTVHFTNNSTGATSYNWDFGDGNSSTALSPLHLYTVAGSYPVFLTAVNNLGCTAIDTTLLSVTPSTDIYGHVSYSGGNVINGNVVIYKYTLSHTRFDTVQVVSLNTSGNYHFTGINHGSYLVQVFADTTVYHTALVSTYYGNAFLWNSPSVIIINQNCNANDTLTDITMAEPPGTGSGIGLLIGQVIEGQGFGRNDGDPIPGVDVKLGHNPGGALIATSTTNSTGHYTFSRVDFGNYTIYVDIPGLGCDSSYTFTVDSLHNQFLHMDYKADSTSIHINSYSSLGINNLANSDENNFKIYPNPAMGNTTIEYSITQLKDVKTTLDVYNAMGIKIKSLVNTNQQPGNYKYNLNSQNSSLNSGIYFITLTVDGKTNTKRIVVME